MDERTLQKQHIILTWTSNCNFKYFFCRENDLRTLFCCKNDLSTLVLLQIDSQTHFFCRKTIYALFCHKKNQCTFFVAKTIYALFCRENNLRTSTGKFLRVESCHPESSDFLGLCPTPPFTESLLL